MSTSQKQIEVNYCFWGYLVDMSWLSISSLFSFLSFYQDAVDVKLFVFKPLAVLADVLKAAVDSIDY